MIKFYLDIRMQFVIFLIWMQSASFWHTAVDTEIPFFLAKCIILRAGLFFNSFLMVLVFTTQALSLQRWSFKVFLSTKQHTTLCTVIWFTLRSFSWSYFLWNAHSKAAISIFFASIFNIIFNICRLDAFIILLKWEL